MKSAMVSALYSGLIGGSMEGPLRRLHLACMLGYQEEGSRAARFKRPLAIMHGFQIFQYFVSWFGI
jgi:hypothetical protein